MDDVVKNQMIESLERFGNQIISDEKCEMMEAEWKNKNHTNRLYEFISQTGERFADVSLDNYETYDDRQKKVLAYCRNYISHVDEITGQGKSLTFLGPPGTGKNHLAYAIAKELILQDVSVTSVGLDDLIIEIKESWRDDNLSEFGVLRKYQEMEYLIIEEIGVQFNSETEKKYLFKILDYKYRHLKPFMLISNGTEKQFRDYIDMTGYSRIWDRLHEVNRIIPCTWESYRRRNRGGRGK